ncbi:MAG: citronellol/citronellal dehydrogenase [Myxococcota bacterium]|jgi:citronellol/citronellal dehydrogenase
MKYQSIYRDDIYKGQVAIVTGGGSGIGRCIAHELASLGATVVISGRKPEKLDVVVGEITASGGKAFAQVCNIRDEDAITSLVDTVVTEHGGIDLLVNNAGGQFMSPPSSISLKGWNAVIETNLTGTFLMCREAKRAWMGKNGGSIVNIVADFRNGMPLMAHTSAARAGVANLTMSCALAWAANGIRMNCVAPGIIKSSGLKNYPPPVVAMLSNVSKETPAKRLGTEAEVSAAVMFFLSPGAAYVTGQTLWVDGGSSLYRQFAPVPDHDRSVAFDGFHLAADLPDGV